MFWKTKSDSPAISWHPLTHKNQLEEIREESFQQPVIIYKHSTTCSISGMALNRLERNWDASLAHTKLYYLDLLSYRSISNEVAHVFQVHHESPQVLVIKDGQVIHNASHMGISVTNIVSALKN